MGKRLSIKLFLASFAFAVFALAGVAQQKSELAASLADYDNAKQDYYQQKAAEQNQVIVSLENAKRQMVRKATNEASLADVAATNPEAAQKQALVTLLENKMDLYQNNPAEYNKLVKQLSSDAAVTQLTQEDYNAASAQKKAYFDAHPEQFVIKSSTK